MAVSHHQPTAGSSHSPANINKVDQVSQQPLLTCSVTGMEEQLTMGLSGVSRDIPRSWQSLTISLPQAAVTALQI